mmetsp:Transcript_20864/g.30560  ORF Transcript_20864/g.30560 Transcript_20864/m.30560 type:complete len:148 (+) Transcript_20864:162-605(+)
MAGCILVDFENLQVINRSHAYKNVYVHHRDSISISKLTDEEIQDRMEVGLVMESNADGDSDYEEDEEFESFEESEGEDSDDERFSFSGRKSSVDPSHCVTSPSSSLHASSKNFSNVTTSRSLQRISEDDEDTINDEDIMDYDIDERS